MLGNESLFPCVPLTLNSNGVASFPVPRPAFRRLQYGTVLSSDEKLGVGLGTRLAMGYVSWKDMYDTLVTVANQACRLPM